VAAPSPSSEQPITDFPWCRIIGGDPRRFAPYIDLYRRALAEFGHQALPIAVHSPGYVGESDEQAIEELWPYYKEGRDRVGASRGWPPVTRAQFDQEVSAGGSLLSGQAETVCREDRSDGGRTGH